MSGFSSFMWPNSPSAEKSPEGRLFFRFNLHLRSSLFFVIILFSLFGGASVPLPANPFMGGGEPKDEVKPARAGSGGTSTILTEIQFGFREKAADYLNAMKSDPAPRLFLALGAAAFLYGLFHGAGPGHRKTIVFSLFLGRKARWWEPLAGGFLAAGVHAAVSLILILILNFIVRGVSLVNSSSRVSVYLEGGTYLLLTLLSLTLLVLSLIRGGHHHLRNNFEKGSGDALAVDIGGGESIRKIYPVILVSSLLPCPGASMILMFSISLGLLGAGIFAIVCMSIGMGVVISTAGYLAFAGREGLFSRLKDNEVWFDRISGLLENGAYIFIICFSLYMAWPFLSSFMEIVRA
ncbi:MAG: hypothetical protein JEY99_12355 [Spirochaetales bacterium]|nr:hypothetical protein [Spirochaetales bacterium]